MEHHRDDDHEGGDAEDLVGILEAGEADAERRDLDPGLLHLQVGAVAVKGQQPAQAALLPELLQPGLATSRQPAAATADDTGRGTVTCLHHHSRRLALALALPLDPEPADPLGTAAGRHNGQLGPALAIRDGKAGLAECGAGLVG